MNDCIICGAPGHSTAQHTEAAKLQPESNIIKDNRKNAHTIAIFDDTEEVCRVDWSSGTAVVTGNVDMGARLFFERLGGYFAEQRATDAAEAVEQALKDVVDEAHDLYQDQWTAKGRSITATQAESKVLHQKLTAYQLGKATPRGEDRKLSDNLKGAVGTPDKRWKS